MAREPHGWFKLEVSFQSANDQRKKFEEMSWSISKTNKTVSNWDEKYGCKWRNKTWLFQRLVAGKSFETLERKWKNMFIILCHTSKTFNVDLQKQLFQVNHMCKRHRGVIFLNLNTPCANDCVALMNHIFF